MSLGLLVTITHVFTGLDTLLFPFIHAILVVQGKELSGPGESGLFV